MSIVARIDKLDVDANLVVRLLNAAFKDMSHPKLLRDLLDIAGSAFEPFGRAARDHFQLRNFCQASQNFVLHAFAEVGVLRIFAEILEWEHSHRLLRTCSRAVRSRRRILGRESPKKEQADRYCGSNDDHINPGML